MADRATDPGQERYTTFAPLRSKTRAGRLVELIARLARFLITAYRYHWIATPAGAAAAVISTVSAASAMALLSPIFHSTLGRSAGIAVNAIIGPLIAYGIYLAVYYFGMFLSERASLLSPATGRIDRAKLKEWYRVVAYDYLAHVPSDIYLISLAALMQAGLEGHGTHIFWAVLVSQFVDDFITFLKEPAIWSGAKEVVAWEKRHNTTLGKSALSKLTKDNPQ